MELFPVMEMPIRPIAVSDAQIFRLRNQRCWICKKKFDGLKILDVLVRKDIGHSKIVHTDCAIEKNWINKKVVQVALLLAEKVRN